jgi:two-component system NtrC family sensor kinase
LVRLNIIIVSLAIITNILLGLFVYFRNPKKATNIFFALMTFSIALWNAAEVLMAFISNYSTALFWDRFCYIGASLVAPFSIHFLVSIVRDTIKRNWKKILIINYSAAGILLCLVFTPFIIKDIVISPYKEIPGPLYTLFIIFFVSCFLYELYILVIGFKKSTGLKKIQISYLFFAYFTGLVTAVVYFFIISAGFNILPLIYVIETGYILVVTYAIIKYRLMDIKSAVSRAGIFVFVYILILGIPFGIRNLIKEHLSKSTSNWWMLPLFLMALLASAGPFIYMRLQKRLESRLRAQEFKSHEALRRLSHNMLRFTNLNVLLRLMVHYLVKVLKLRFAAIYLFDRQSNKYLLSSFWQSGEGAELPQEYKADGYLADYLHLKKLPVVTEELSLYAPIAYTPKIKNLFSELSGFKINTAIPCFLRNNLMGFLILSDRRGNIPFTQDDLNLLMVLSNEAALAIENAQFHQKEVSQLVEKSKREALADMAPGASHQFNNRLASISSSVELLLFKMENFNIEAHKDENTKSLLRDAKAALELIDSEVYKGKEITSAILKRAKAKVEFQEFSLVDLIENTYKLVMISRSRSGLDKARELKFNIVSSGDMPNIFASEALLQDVFYNLIDNAYDAIQDKARIMSQSNPLFQGEIEVTLRREDHFITAQVRDNGIGLKKEDHRKLFTPYFTTKATSNKGSGLGLCIIRDFIEIHKGSIACDSEYGKGATFTIRIPIKKEK